MLSKNFEYTGQRLYLSNIGLPMSRAPASATASRSVNRSPSKRDVAQAFVRHAAFVGGFGRAGKPALVDAAAIRTVGVPIVRMQLDALARMQKARGTQVGVSRSKPSAASNARSRSLPQLSLVAILEGTVERIKVVGVMNAVTPRK